jgi:hypothetical protein
MNEALFASIYLDTSVSPEETAHVVAALVDGTVIGRHVDCAWARITVDDDYGDFEIRKQDPDDFLGWKTLLEVMPHDTAAADAVVIQMRALISGLLARAWRVLPQCDYADRLQDG